MRSSSQGSGALPLPPSPPSFAPSAGDRAHAAGGFGGNGACGDAYPYATASAEADLSALSVTYGPDRRTDALHRKAALKVVENLVPEVDAMFGGLVVEMAKREMPAS